MTGYDMVDMMGEGVLIDDMMGEGVLIGCVERVC